jgi:predicted TIM-barrel fold metal-dependent hydrolase
MIIDADTHVFPMDAMEYLPDTEVARRCPKYWFGDDGLFKKMEFPGELIMPGTNPTKAPGSGANYKGSSNIEARLEDYQRMGIDKQFLFPQLSTLRLTYVLDSDVATAMAHSYNQSIINLVRKHPKELIGGAMVALQDVDGAISELEWCVKEGIRAVILDKVFPVREHIYSETLGSHRELWPFWAKCEELGIPVFLHNISHGHRISNLMRFQMDGLEIFAAPDGHMSLMSLITSGVLDAYPNLKLVFTEAGTAFIRGLVERFDRAFESPPLDYDDEEATPRYNRHVSMLSGRRLTSPEVYRHKNKKPPSEYFRKNVYFTIETEEEELPDAIDFLGASQFLFATDYPHDDPGGRMKFKDVALLNANKRISDGDKELIFYKNAQDILGDVAA